MWISSGWGIDDGIFCSIFKLCRKPFYSMFGPTIVTMINPIASLLLFIGLILILSDPPFLNSRSAMMFYRATRKTWMCGMLCYMVFHIILYYAFLLAVSMVSTMSHSYTGNVWSRALMRMVSVEKMAATSKYGIFVPNQSVFEHFSPFESVISIYVCLFYAEFYL